MSTAEFSRRVAKSSRPWPSTMISGTRRRKGDQPCERQPQVFRRPHRGNIRRFVFDDVAQAVVSSYPLRCGFATRHAPHYVDDFLPEKRILHAHGVAQFALCVGHRYHVARTLWLPECNSSRNLSTRRSAPKPWSWRPYLWGCIARKVIVSLATQWERRRTRIPLGVEYAET